MAKLIDSPLIEAISVASLPVITLAPAVAMGYVYQGTAQALSNAANNATSIQQNGAILDHATTSTGVAMITAQGPSTT